MFAQSRPSALRDNQSPELTQVDRREAVDPWRICHRRVELANQILLGSVRFTDRRDPHGRPTTTAFDHSTDKLSEPRRLSQHPAHDTTLQDHVNLELLAMLVHADRVDVTGHIRSTFLHLNTSHTVATLAV